MTIIVNHGRFPGSITFTDDAGSKRTYLISVPHEDGGWRVATPSEMKYLGDRLSEASDAELDYPEDDL